MAPPTSEEIFGSLKPIPASDLVDDERVYKMLGAAGSSFEVEERLIDGRVQSVYKQLPSSMREFWQSSSADVAFGRREYIVFNDERMTYGQAYEKSVLVARWLQRQFQIRKGDRVGLVSRNYPEFVVAFWAVHLLGAVASVLNAFHDGDTLSFSIKDVSCQVVLCDGERYQRLESSDAKLVVMPWMGARRVERQSDKSWMRDEVQKKGNVYDWQTLMEEEEEIVGQLVGKGRRSLFLPDVLVQPEDNACILFTSGTTGKPKGVLSTQRQFLSCLRLASFASARALLRRRRPLPPPPDPTSDDQSSVLLLVPLAHTTGLQSGLVLATATGTKMVMMAAYNREKSIDLAQKEGVRGILGIGFMVREIVLSGAKLPNVQQFGHGGSSSAKELPNESSKHHAHTVISAGYGLTEVNGVAAALMMDDYHARPSSAGKPPLGVELMIVEPESGVRLYGKDKVGELWIRTPGRAKGYWNRPKETSEVFLADGWFRSGDLAKIDDDGFVFIVDRVKDIIVRGGENISCTHVESAIYGHPKIADCAAVALPDERLGERVGVVCIVKDSNEGMPAQDEIMNLVANSLPKYAVPEFIWLRKEPLPRNANGKVLRNEVKRQAIQHAKEQNWTPRETASAQRSKL